MCYLFSEQLNEVLRYQAEEKLQCREMELRSTSYAPSSMQAGIKAHFPIGKDKDFVKFNNDLKDLNYADAVVSFKAPYLNFTSI